MTNDKKNEAMKNQDALKNYKYTDLPDSQEDKEKLKPEITTIDLPEVNDIPGQEHIHVPPLGELADTTISSDDEEGASVFDDGHEEDFPGDPVMDVAVRDEAEEDETKPVMGNEADVSDEEREALRRADEDMPTQDDRNLRRAALDNKDADGDRLNEDSRDVSGEDLDVPGASLDDENERIGEEDEENNQYSLGGDKHD